MKEKKAAELRRLICELLERIGDPDKLEAIYRLVNRIFCQ